MDWEMLCRVCLQNGDLVSLFDSDENDELLSDKFTYCSNVEVTTTDLLPSQICLSCVDRLLTAYQFKQQCVSSNNTLKECLAEFKQATQGNTEQQSELDESELITVKQENGTYVQYEVPVEGSTPQWGRPSTPVKRGRGRPRKYPNELGEITVSPYQKRKDSLNDMVVMKEEPLDDDEDIDYSMEAEDPDYEPESDGTLQFITEDGTTVKVKSNKKSRSRTKKSREVSMEAEEADDVLLMEETLLAETKQPDPMLTQPKPKKKYAKKKYQYEKTHTCEVCGSSFRSNASLQAHIRRHLGIKPFSCTICGYSCVLNMELRRHMMRHTGARPYQCRICERRFGDFGSRQKHERLHLGQRPYMCSLCGKNFTYSYVLANHMLTHTGEKKYSCELCNKKFTKSHHLKYHNKVHHKALYIQQQMELDAKKLQHTNINISEFGHHFLGSNVQLSGQDVQTLISESGGADIKQEAYTLAQVEEMEENEEQYEPEHNQQYQHQDETEYKLQIDPSQSEDGQDQELQQHQVLLGTDIRIQHYTDEGGETTIVCEIPENIAEQFQGQIQGQIQEIHEQEQHNTKGQEIEDAQDDDSIENETEHLLQIQQDEDTS